MAIKSASLVLKCDCGTEELQVECEWDSIVFTVKDRHGNTHRVYISPDEADLFVKDITNASKSARENA